MDPSKSHVAASTEALAWRLSLIEQVASAGSFAHDEAAGTVEWSGQLRCITGLDPNAAPAADTLAGLVHPADLAAFTTAWQSAHGQTSAEGKDVTWQGRLVRPDSDIREVRVTLRHRGEESDQLVGIVVDLTEQHALDKQANETRKMQALSRLAGHIAHDFNNLLLVIIANAALLQEDVDRPELEEIQQAADVAGDLARRLAAFGQGAPITTRAVDMSAAIREALPRIERSLGRGQHLALDLRPNAEALAPADGIDPVLIALVRNAAEATEGGGTVTISARNVNLRGGNTAGLPPGLFVEVLVTDTGVGMDEETRGRALEPFFTTHEDSHNAGLGLSMVYGAMQLVGGAMDIRSQLGHGTQVALWFPTSDGSKPMASDSLPPKRTTTGKTVLVLEDEPAVLRVIRAVLERAGFTVHAASHPDDALAIAAGLEQIDLVLSDVVTPGGGGARLVKDLRRGPHDFRVLFMTGYAPQETTLDGPVLLKPFLPEDLMNRVLDVLGDPS